MSRVDPATGLPVVGQGASQQQIEEAQRRIKVMHPTRAIFTPAGVTFLDGGETVHDLYASKVLSGMVSNAELMNLFMEQDDNGQVKFNVIAMVEKAFEMTAAAMSYREKYFEMMTVAQKQKEAAEALAHLQKKNIVT